MDKILYLDDESANLSAFKASYRHDYDITITEDPQNALELCREKNFKVVLSDQRMPELEGSKFFQQLIEIDPKPVRILITAYSDPESLKEAVNKGQIYFFVQKPFEHEEMKAILSRAISEYDLREANEGLELKNERIEKEKVRAVLHNLQNQVNPHFLFNSLNMLHALIGKDQEKAREYVLQLSEFLRISLEHKDMDTTSLEQELETVSKYLYIQKIRFGDAIGINKKIDDKFLGKELPVMSLQICMENALKHNIMSKDEPLNISMTATESGITISNPFRPRGEDLTSSGVGQENLKSRYRLFGSELPIFGSREGIYRSWLPFL